MHQHYYMLGKKITNYLLFICQMAILALHINIDTVKRIYTADYINYKFLHLELNCLPFG